MGAGTAACGYFFLLPHLSRMLMIGEAILTRILEHTCPRRAVLLALVLRLLRIEIISLLKTTVACSIGSRGTASLSTQPLFALPTREFLALSPATCLSVI